MGEQGWLSLCREAGVKASGASEPSQASQRRKSQGETGRAIGGAITSPPGLGSRSLSYQVGLV